MAVEMPVNGSRTDTCPRGNGAKSNRVERSILGDEVRGGVKKIDAQSVAVSFGVSRALCGHVTILVDRRECTSVN